MTTQLRDEDIELLSAYLDGQIDAGERAALEQRLEREPLLRTTLDELRATVGMLRELPSLTPPRSFTLDTAAVRRPTAWAALAGWMRLGSALAAVLLAFSVTFEFMGSRSESPASMPTGGFALATPASSAAGGGAPEADSSLLVAPSAPADSSTTSQATAPPEPRAAESLSEPTAAPGALASEAPAGTMSDGAAPDVGATAQEPESAAPPVVPQIAEGPAARDMIDSPQSNSPDTQKFSTPPAKTGNPPPQLAFEPLRLVQISLAALALLLGLGSVWLARRPGR